MGFSYFIILADPQVLLFPTAAEKKAEIEDSPDSDSDSDSGWNSKAFRHPKYGPDLDKETIAMERGMLERWTKHLFQKVNPSCVGMIRDPALRLLLYGIEDGDSGSDIEEPKAIAEAGSRGTRQRPGMYSA